MGLPATLFGFKPRGGGFLCGLISDETKKFARRQRTIPDRRDGISDLSSIAWLLSQ